MDFKEKYAEYKKSIEECLKLPELQGLPLAEPILYSLNAGNTGLSGGKRIRPVLMLAFYEAYGGNANSSVAVTIAGALEMLHTSTLIQDDLPCMDDDDLRRGKPSCHKAFSEADAVLSASTMAYYALREIAGTKLTNSAEIIKEICAYMGLNGVYGGQKLDLFYEKQTPSAEEILQMYQMKTCALLKACCVCGCLAANTEEKAVANAAEFADKLGLAFQITDDILEFTSSAEILGKPVNSDIKNKKRTYASVTGLEKAKEDAEKFTNEALKLLKNIPNPEFLTELTKNLLNREN